MSPIAGKGAALAIGVTYLLAGELKKAAGNHEATFRNYQWKLKPEAERTQKMGRDFVSFFVPDTASGIWKRNMFTYLMFLPVVSPWLIRQLFSENWCWNRIRPNELLWLVMR